MRIRDLVQRARQLQQAARCARRAEPTPPTLQAPRPDERRRAFQLEPMEPRVLLSATPFYSAEQASAGLSMTLAVADRQGVQTLVLSDEQGQQLAAAALSSLQGPVVITGSRFDDRLQLDTAAAASALSIQFDGGGGSDTLAGDARDTDWRLDGADAGSLAAGSGAGALSLAFQSVEQLQGASGNQDRFTLAAAGSLSGTLDGGVGGFDTLVFEPTAVARAVYQAFGADSGTVQHDARLTRYAGLEPIIDNSTVAARSFSATAGDDQIEVLSNNDGTTTIRSLNATPTFESLTFNDAGTRSIAIDTGTGQDTLRLRLLGRFDQGVSVNAQDSITLQGVDLRDNFSLSARHRISASAALISTGQADLALRVSDTSDTQWGQSLVGIKDNQATAAIDLQLSTLLGRNITLSAQASTTTLADVDEDLAPDVTAQVMADFNGDGRLDLVQGQASGDATLYLNNGSATPFDGVTGQVIGRNPVGGPLNLDVTALAAGDVDNDGDIDLLIGTANGRPRLALNSGNSASPFGTATLLDVGLAPAVDPVVATHPSLSADAWGRIVGVALADVDNDGKLDAVIARSGGNTPVASHVYLNSGGADVFYTFRNDIGVADANVNSLAVGDVNGDGRADVLLGRSTGGALLYTNLDNARLFNGSAAAPTRYGDASDQVTAVAIGDATGDGRNDIVIARANGATQLWGSQGAGRPTALTEIGSADDKVTTIAIGNVGGSATPDLVLGSASQPTRVYLNQRDSGSASNPAFSGTGLVVGDADDTAAVSALTLGDVNGDGRADLVLGRNGALSTVFANTVSADAADSPFENANASIVNPDSSLIQRLDESAGLGLNLYAAVVTSTADAQITLGNRSIVNASGNVDIQSTALADASNTTVGFGLGITYAHADSSAITTLGGASSIIAAGTVRLGADTVNNLKASTLALSPGVLNFSLAYGELDTEARAEVQAGATVQGSSVSVGARNDNRISTSASGFNFAGNGGGVSAGVAAGLGIAIGSYQSSAQAGIYGQAVARSGDVQVEARSVATEDATRASASVLNPPNKVANLDSAADSIGGPFAKAASLLGKAFNPGNGGITGRIGQALSAGSTPSLTVAGGIAYAESSHQAQARLGDNAVVRASGDVRVDSRAEDNIRLSATGSASDAESVAIGGAVAVGQVHNSAQAAIGDRATVDAGGLLHVRSNALVPHPLQSTLPSLQFSVPEDATGAPNSDPASRVSNGYQTTAAAEQGALAVVTDGVVPFVSGLLLGSTGPVATSYAQGSGSPKSGGSAGIGGAVNVMLIDNNSQASIGRNARINQTQPRAATQDVWVEALSSAITVNLAGQASVLSVVSLALGSDTTAGVGGDFLYTGHTGNTQAWIADGAVVSAGRDVKVTANNLDQLISVALQGGQAGAVGVNGAIGVTDVSNRTEAWAEDSASLSAGRDAAIQAGSTLMVVNVDGAIGIGDAAGVGASLAVNLVRDQTVRAFFGDHDGTREAAATPGLSALRDIDISAGSNAQVFAVAAAGGVASEGVDKPKPSGADFKALLRSPAFNLAEFEKATQGQQYGYGVGGGVAVNQLLGSTDAHIDSAMRVTAGGSTEVLAQDRATLVQAGGAFGVGRDTGIGGSAAALELDRSTHAYIDNASLLVGDLRVQADAQDLVVGAALSGGGAMERAAAAGSVVVALMDTDTQAWIDGGATVQRQTVGDVTVSADHRRNHVDVAGAVAVGVATNAAVGAGIAAVQDDTVVKAWVGRNTPFDASGSVRILAANQDTGRTVAAAGAVSASSGSGVAGAAAAQVASHTVEASTASNLVAQGQVRLDADDRTDRLVLAGMAAGGREAGVGVSVGLASLTRNVSVSVADGLTVTAANLGVALADPQGGSFGSGRGVTLEATSSDSLVLLAAGGAGGGNAGVAASAAVDLLTSTTDARVGAGARIGASNLQPGASSQPGVAIRAHDDRDAVLVGGSVAGSGKAGVGAVVVTQKSESLTRAHVESSSAQPTTVLTGGDFLMDASATDTVTAVAAGLGGGGQGGGAGSVAVVQRTHITETWTGERATLTVGGSAAITADTTLSADVVAGAGGFGGQGGVGASNATVAEIAVTQATLGALNTVAVNGGAATALAVPSGQRSADGRKTTTPVAGLTLAATQRERLRPVAVGAGGGGYAGVAGSVTVTDLYGVTRASVGAGSTVTANQQINLLASDDTDIVGAAGAVAGSGGAAVGGGADGGSVNKTVEALVLAPASANGAASRLTATNGDVRIRALSDDKLLSVGVAGALSGAVGVAGSASVWLVTEQTAARIGDRSVVLANGNVQLEAQAQTQLSQVSGSLAAAGSVGVGAAVGASTLSKTTEASIGESAQVTARANTAALQAASGQFAAAGASFITPSGSVDTAADSLLFLQPHRLVDGQAVVYRSNGQVPIGGLVDGQTYYVIRLNDNQLQLAASLDDAVARRAVNLSSAPPAATPHSLLPAGSVPLPTIGNSDIVATGQLDALIARRSVVPVTEAFRGLAVTAVSRESVEAFAASAGGGGVVGVQVAGAGHRSEVNTRASVGSRARLNADGSNANTGADQSVRVLAADNSFHLGAGGSAGYGGVAAVSPGVDAVVIRNSTTASVADGSSINARRDLQVQALAEENLLTVAVGLAGSGNVAVAGSLAGQFITTQTQALLGSASAGAGAGPVVNVGGNASVLARDLTAEGLITGAGAVSPGGGGFSAGIGLAMVSKATQAQIGANAVVNALGNSSTLNAFSPGSGLIADNLGSQRSFTGVQVAADSREQVFSVAVSGAGGGVLGLAGGVTAELLQSATTASVGAGARLNDNGNAGAAATQSVVVTATNQVSSFGAAGAVAGGGVGALAGGVDVQVLRDDTRADIGSGARVTALADVVVDAIARHDLVSRAGSAAAGSVGIAGSVSVVAIGSALDASAQRALQANDSGNSTSTGQVLDQQTSGSGIGNALGGYSAPPADSSADAASRFAALSAQGRTALGAGSGASAATLLAGAAGGGTRASVASGAQISSGGSVALRAREADAVSQIAGTAALGVAAAGGAVAVANVAAPVTASIDATPFGSAPTRISAGGDLTISARQTESHSGNAYAAAGGLVGALGAQVVVFSDDSDQQATLGQGAYVDRARAVQVDATVDRTLTDGATGGAGGGVAATGSVVRQSVTGDTLASVANAVNIGTTAGGSVGSLTVLADADLTSRANTQALAVAAVGGAGADSALTVSTVTRGWIDAGTRVATSGNVAVGATARLEGIEQASGLTAGGLTVGVNRATSQVTSTVSADLGNSSEIRAGGSVSFTANGQQATTDLAEASSGSLIGGAAALSSSTVLHTVKAELADGAQVQAGGSVSLRALADTLPSARSTDQGVAFVSAGTSKAVVDMQANTSTRVGLFAAISAGSTVTLQAQSSNRPENPAGGVLIPGTADSATARASDSAEVNVARRQTTEARVEQGAVLRAPGAISLSANGDGRVDGFASSPTQPIGGRPSGSVSVNLLLDNRKSVTVGPDARVESGATLTLSTAGDTQANSTASGGALFIGPSQRITDSDVGSIGVSSGSQLAAASMVLSATGTARNNLGTPTANQNTVQVDGDLFKIGAQNRVLSVGSDGRVAIGSNLAASVAADGTVTVADLTPATDGSALRVAVTATPGRVLGTGLVNQNSVLRAVTIGNQSAGNLVLGRLDAVLATAQPAPVVTVNGAVVASPWQVFNSGSGVLRVLASGGGGIAVNGVVNARGDVSLQAQDRAGSGQNITLGTGGQITDSGGNILLAAGDNLVAAAGARVVTDRNLQIQADLGSADVGLGAVVDLSLASELSGTQSVEISTGNDADTVSTGRQALGRDKTAILTGDGADVLSIAYLDADAGVELQLGGGNDIVTLGTVVDAAGNRRLSDIASAGLRLDGGAGNDTVVWGNSAGTAATSATLGASSFSGGGLGTAAAVALSQLENLTLLQGSGADTLTVGDTNFLNLTVQGNGGNDTVNLSALRDGAAVFRFEGGAGDDRLLLGSRQPATGGVMANLRGSIGFVGGAGSDSLLLDDSGNTVATSTTLGNGVVQGFGLPAAGLTYSGAESLTLNLGSGNDSVRVNATTPGTLTTVNGGAGNDTVTGVLTGVTVNQLVATVAAAVAADAADDGATPTAARAGAADAAAAGISIDNLQFNGGDGIDQLTLDDSADAGTTALTITRNTITGTGIGTGVGYASVENLDLQAGAGGSNYTIQSSAAGTTLGLHGSAGNDVVTITPTAAAIVYDAGAGDDVIRIAEPNRLTGATGQVTVIGGAGNDTLIGSSADDVLYGDGVNGEAATDGDDVIIGGLGNDRIVAGGGNDLVFGDLGRVDVSWVRADEDDDSRRADAARIGGGDEHCDAPTVLQTTVQTLFDPLGGQDSISAGSGDDLVFGGAGNDTLDLGEGRNIGFGDTGLVRYRDGRIERIDSSEALGAGNDSLVAGAGDDVLLGGGGVDRLDAGNGHNLLFADGGRLSWEAGRLAEIESRAVAFSWGDQLKAGSGNDLLFGSDLFDRLDGGTGSNRLLPTGGEIDNPRDSVLIDWSNRLEASTLTTSDTSRQARWLKQALASRAGISPWDVAGTANASLSVSLSPVAAGGAAGAASASASTAMSPPTPASATPTTAPREPVGRLQPGVN